MIAILEIAAGITFEPPEPAFAGVGEKPVSRFIHNAAAIAPGIGRQCQHGRVT